MPSNVRKHKKPVWLGTEMVHDLRAYLNANPSVTNTALLVMLITAMRPGEVLGLDWSNISLETGDVNVCQGVQRSEDGRVRTVVPILKTPDSERSAWWR